MMNNNWNELFTNVTNKNDVDVFFFALVLHYFGNFFFSFDGRSGVGGTFAFTVLRFFDIEIDYNRCLIILNDVNFLVFFLVVEFSSLSII